MKCPTCMSPCLETDTWCLSCRTPMVASRKTITKSAMWLCTPLFGVLGAGLYLGLAKVAPNTRGGNVNWDHLTNLGLVAIGSALFGAAAGWVLDMIARRN